jgi:tetratricopeptide (TPR) repeat protein
MEGRHRPCLEVLPMFMEQDPALRQAIEAVAALPPHSTPVAEHTAGGLWRLPRAADAVTHALRSEDRAARDRGWLMVRTRVAEEIGSGRDWTREAAIWLARGDADWEESARITADLAWRARAEGRSALLFLTGGHIAATDPATPYGRALWHCFLTTLRYDFRCAAIEEFFTEVTERLDPYSEAVRAFALLGRSRPEGLDLMTSVLARAAHDDKVVHALLHGLWLGEDLPDQPERMLDLLRAPAFADGLGAEALYRRASALRRLRRFDEALTAVQSAIDHLDPAQVVVHTDCVRERALILAERDLYRDGAGRLG